MTRYLLPVSALDSRFPLRLGTIYNHSYRKSAWLTRIGPLGRQGCLLWIDIMAYNSWARGQGWKHQLELNHPMVVIVEPAEEEMEEGAH